MKTLQQFVGFLIRLLVVWLVDTLALLATAALLSGVQISAVDNRPVFVVAVAVAFTLGIVNFLVRPFLLLAALPLGWAAVFLAGFVINGVVLQIASALMPGFVVDGLWAGILGGFILSLFNTILTTLLAIDDEDSFYENLVQRQAIRQAGSASSGSGRGLVILETDGLSYQRIQKAIAAGVMPTLKQLNELNFAYPGLVDALVRHEGIGFVIAYDDDCIPVAFGKQGAATWSAETCSAKIRCCRMAMSICAPGNCR